MRFYTCAVGKVEASADPDGNGLVGPEGTPLRLVAEPRLTQDQRDTTIRVAERMWVYTTCSLDRFRGVNLQGEDQCARKDLLEESS